MWVKMLGFSDDERGFGGTCGQPCGWLPVVVGNP